MRNIIFLLLFLSSLHAWGQQYDSIDRVVEVSVVSNNPTEAKAKLNELAVLKASEDLIKEIIGESKYNRSISTIREKILKNAAKFIPLTKSGDLIKTSDGYQTTTQLKFNLSDLKAMLLQQGLFYESDATPMVLPMVRITDKVNFKTLSWWIPQEAQEREFLININRSLENALRENFIRNNFYVLRPYQAEYVDFLQGKYHVEKLRPTIASDLARSVNAQIFLDGDLVISKSTERSEAFNMELRISATQTVNNRVIAEVVRKMETDVGSFEVVIPRKIKQLLDQATSDLSSQVYDAWQKGALGSSLYRLVINGPMPIKAQETFKQLIRSRILEIKNIKERSLSEDMVVYEVDANISPQEIARRLPNVSVEGINLKLSKSSEAEIVYNITK